MKRKFSFETLEQRQALAGNVAASLSGSVLTITGDALANSLDILGAYTGANQTGVTIDSPDTTINGVAGPVTFNGVRNIIVRLNDGDDFIFVNNLVVDTLIIDTGNGSDFVNVGPFGPLDLNDPAAIAAGSVGVNNRLEISAGAGEDTVITNRVFGGANWLVSLGDDNDQFSSYWTTGSRLDLQGGNGDDGLQVYYHTGSGDLVMGGGEGNDLLGLSISAIRGASNFGGGNGNNTIAVNPNKLDGQVTIFSGDNDDEIYFAANVLGAGLTIGTGDGDDYVVLGQTYDGIAGGNVIDKGSTGVDTGSGDDTLDLFNGNYRNFFATLGEGADEAYYNDFFYVRSNGALNGGRGTDLLESIAAKTFFQNLNGSRFNLFESEFEVLT